MRILYVIADLSPSCGGPTHNLVEYIRAIKQRGHKATVACLNGDLGTRSDFQARSQCNEVISFSSRLLQQAKFSISFIIWLIKNRNNFDVVHISGLLNPFTSISARVCINLGLHTIVTLNGSFDHRSFRTKSRLKKTIWLNIIDRYIIRKSTIHVESLQEQNGLIGLIGEDINNITVVPPVIHVNAPLICAHNKRTNILCLSRIHPIKNIECIIDSWSQVAKQFAHCELIIAGEGTASYKSDIMTRARAIEYGSNRIKFVGWLSGKRKQDAFDAASIFIAASHYESFGRSIIEAVSNGITCIVTSRANISNDLCDEGVGISFNHSPADLSDKIISAIQDDEFRRKVLYIGPHYVRRKHSRRVIGAQLENMYLAPLKAN